ncbi:Mre11, putative [Entamoeba histolytica HM-1:IMSS-B]|uniref:Mre11, putative n=5 Tax=Entamoeba histolytica TaxID=5759 RepID=M3UR61_ENTH1|nr:Mre11, putative [Entamoeba histolytica KU27]EMH73407.1 Mre11, putative [Entamoeba histolytica HM-1:IMSS-B]EMS12834.1 Mre11, putative [Entamoeba histolytica HM-3:IMSS]ENY61352.1 Mre11, putative [Entamoeba histolytica HM-1:IMSS-A]
MSITFFVTGDNHLGYYEKNLTLKDDCYKLFEQYLKEATQKEGSILLQCGDLFNDLRPNKSCVSKTANLIKKYCIGDADIPYTIKDEAELSYPLNITDPYINVKHPLFTIHGTNDEPSGYKLIAGSEILASCGLVNYISPKSFEEEKMLKPVIIVNEHTKIALYGLSVLYSSDLDEIVEDETFHIKKPNGNDWICILLLYIGKGTISQTTKDIIEKHFNIIILGGQHSCNIPTGEFNGSVIIQPGSPFFLSFDEYDEIKKGFVKIVVEGQKIYIEKKEYKPIHRMIKKEVYIPETLRDCVISKRIEDFIQQEMKKCITEAVIKENEQILLKLIVKDCNQDCYPDTKKISSLLEEDVVNFIDCIKVKKWYRQEVEMKELTIEDLVNEELDKYEEPEKVIRRKEVSNCLERLKMSSTSSNIEYTTDLCMNEVSKKAMEIRNEEKEKGMESDYNNIVNEASIQVKEKHDESIVLTNQTYIKEEFSNIPKKRIISTAPSRKSFFDESVIKQEVKPTKSISPENIKTLQNSTYIQPHKPSHSQKRKYISKILTKDN